MLLFSVAYISVWCLDALACVNFVDHHHHHSIPASTSAAHSGVPCFGRWQS
ncbi:hypothetical protein sync_1085 [Synechococcus sp. CC9311]|nr:hypothetical protein sync_1085 [Synechococcus sp. CC9311]